MRKLRKVGAAILLGAGLLVAGCGGGDKASEPPHPQRGSGWSSIGPRGGTVAGADGATVLVPRDAMASEYVITISRDSEGAPPLPPSVTPAGAMYAITPHGARFRTPVYVTLPIDDTPLPQGQEIAILRGNVGQGWELIRNAKVRGNSASVLTQGFSFFIPTRVPIIVAPPPPTTPASAAFVEWQFGGLPTATRGPAPLFDGNGDPLRDFTGALVEPDPVTYTVVTQQTLTTPLRLTLRGAVPPDSLAVTICQGRGVEFQVGIRHVRVGPAHVRLGGFELVDNFNDASALRVLARLRAPADGSVGSIGFDLNLAQYTYLWGGADNRRVAGGFFGGSDSYVLIEPDWPAGMQLFVEAICVGEADFARRFAGGIFGGTALIGNAIPVPANKLVARRGGWEGLVGFVSQPGAQTAVAGDEVSFRATLPLDGQGGLGLGPAPTDVQWQRNFASAPNAWFDIPAAAAGSADWAPGGPDSLGTITLRKPAVDRFLDDQAEFRVRLCPPGSTNPAACVTSQPARLTVTTNYVAPQVTQQPVARVTVREGVANAIAQFSAAFSGTPRPTMSWQTKAPGATDWSFVDLATHNVNGATLSVQRTFTLADRGREYRAVGVNGGGVVYSNASALWVTTGQQAPTITTQPVDVAAGAGAAVLFAASADGAPPLNYQWSFNGTPITGANGPVLTLNGVNAANAGNYALEVSNAENSVRSRTTRLSVSTGSPPVTGPIIVTQPASLTVAQGSAASFAIGLADSTAATYQWRRDGNPIPGATQAVYAIARVADVDAGAYSVLVTSGSASVTSAVATLNATANPGPMVVAPTITTQPEGLTVNPGQTATLAIAATGSGPLAYLWQRNGVAVPNATGPVLTFTTTTANDAGSYTVLVSNSAGGATSQVAGLVVTPVPGAPSITGQPGSRSVLDGQRATFTLAVSGNPAPQCQWTRNSVAVAGATSCTGYTTADTTIADNGTVYNVVVYSPGGVAIGNGAVLTVSAGAALPVITQDLADVTAPEGGTATFSVVASANGPLFHYWTRIGAPTTPLGGSIFDIGPLQASDDGATVRVIVCNGPIANNRCTTSRDARLTVTPAVPANALTATQIVAGQEWSLVLRPDGTVWAWGQYIRNDGAVQYANLLSANQAWRPVRMYPTALTDVRAISGWFHGFWALKGEPGTTGSRVLHWGRADAGSDGRGGDGNGSLGGVGNPGGQIAPRDNEAAPVEVLERVNNVPRPVDRVCAIAGGGEQLAMIRAINSAGATTDCNAGSAKTVWFVGSLLARGYDSTGVAFAMPGLPVDSPPAVIFTGQTTSGSPPLVIALEDGRLYGLGNNPFGGLGVAATGSGIVGDLTGPLLLPSTWGNARSFGMSFYYSLFAVRADGSVMTSGYDNTGELGLGSVIGGSILGPRSVLAETCTSLPCGDALTGVAAIAATQTGATLALKNGQILGWGARDSNGLRGPGVTANQPFPLAVPSTVSGFTALSASYAHALVIGPGNVVYAWGSGLRGALGDGTGNDRTAPGMVTTPP